MDEITKIPEMLNSITATMKSDELSKMCQISTDFNTASCSPEMWLKNIKTRFGVDLNNRAAYDLLLKFFERNIVINANVTILDEKAADENNAVKILGKMLISATDTVAEIVDRLDKQFGILGDVAICGVVEDDFTSDRYIFTNYSEFEQCTENYIHIETDAYILHHTGRISVPWFVGQMQSVIPQALPTNTEIVFVKYDYSAAELKKIRSKIVKALAYQRAR